MTNESPKGPYTVTVNEDGSWSVTFSSAPVRVEWLRSPFRWTPAPDHFTAILGRIAVLWSMFECDFDRFLDKLLASAEPPAQKKSSEIRSFAARLKLARKEVPRVFASSPGVAVYILEVLEWVKTLQTARNGLIHGSISVKVNASSDADTQNVHVIFTLEVVSRSHGKTELRSLSEDDLEKLAHDLGHLAGIVEALIDPARTETLKIPAEGRAAVRSFIEAT